MISSPFTLSPPFLSAKSSLNATPPPPPSSVSFHHVSAAYAATAERPTITSAPHFATPESLYDILGIQAGATRPEIKAAYHRLARMFHPDVKSNDRKDASADEFIRIHAAYSTLYDPKKRADYDRNLIGRQQCGMSPRFSGRARRTWETDQCW